MKKIITLVSLLVMTMSAQAEMWKSKPLLAIEGAFVPVTSIDYKSAPGASEVSTDVSGPGVGIKIGAEGEEFRIFISGRYTVLENIDYVISGGVEFQYLIRLAKAFNIFIGVEGGAMSLKFNDSNFGASSGLIRTIDTPYYGGDIGFNLDIGESFGVELGGRLIQLVDAENIRLNSAGTDSIVRMDFMPSVYASLIFKFLPN